MDNASNVSSEEELLELRNEGRISEARASEDGGGGGELSGKAGEREIPGVLWIALVSLGLMVVGKLFFVSHFGGLILVDAVLSGGLLIGLYLGHRWAYILTIVFVALGTIGAFSKGFQQGLTVLVLDCLVLVPVLMCREYFFGGSAGQRTGTQETFGS